MGRLFGTDGVRGVANADLTAELALGLLVAAAHVLAEAGTFAGHRATAVVGRDPRASGEFLEAAVVAGLASAGVDVLRVGVLPTPAVAHLTGALGADLGVMLSASHNAMPDNGIKFFARGGHKLADELEDRIESVYAEHRTGAPGTARPAPASAGSATTTRGSTSTSPTSSVSSPNRLDGLKIVLDEAHGAPPGVSPEAFARAGAELVTIGAVPDGLNINDGCGSTHLDLLKAAVVEHGADLGIAHDGDADRCLAVDHTGAEVDGDQILAVLALAMRERDALRPTPSATVMSNLGSKLAMEREGIRFAQTGVGDRARPGGDEGARLRPRWRAVRARHHPRPRHHR